MERKLNKRQQQHQKTLYAIRDAVDRLVPELGFDKMRIVDICREVGVTPGAFYTYFKSKDELLYDRYVRTNKAFWAFYEENLRELNEIDALQSFMLYFIHYLKTRIPDVLKSYQKAQLEYLHEWVSKEASAQNAIILTLLDKGRVNKSIATPYSNEEVLAMLCNLSSGITFRYICALNTERASIIELSMRTMQDWIASLRA